MHWSSNIQENLKPRKAESDIRTFKVCRLNASFKEAYPYHYPFTESYKVGRQYGMDADAISVIDNSIYKGYKTYDEEKNLYMMSAATNKVCVVARDTSTAIGYYGCSSRPPMKTTIMKCIVPKGAIYYENEFGEIVSNQIKVLAFEAPESNIT